MSISLPRPTIFAPATATGRAGVAVIRVSGPAAGAALRALTGTGLPPPRKAVRARFRDPDAGTAIDDGLALWFPSPASFTGEDVAEFHFHGSRAVLTAMVAALGGMEGLRLAEPGEFTRRAFDAGKLDLTEVEGLADLIEAETEAQRRQALRQLSGEFGRLVETWRIRLLKALAYAEAEIDFPDEDLPGRLVDSLRPDLERLIEEIGHTLADERRGERLREGLSIAILGPPNAGKSSLLNALARREAAIVSAIAGTTRDVIEVHLDLGGYPVVVADTAGLREIPVLSATADLAAAQGQIEAEGVRRALARAEAADLKLLVLDATDREIEPAIAALIDADTLVVRNKIDLIADPKNRLSEHGAALAQDGKGPYPISVRSGAGMAALLGAVASEVAARLAGGSTAPPITRARHRRAIEDCQGALIRALAAGDLPAELFAEDLRLAARALGQVVGRVGVEDVLDAIFREFCIGK
ncbi:MAG: tRNA uridine-5-carboxymethylaminomethyl(34) synthesis GTPase MnmE [Rhodospirillales bacterium]|nr:tRNA uridine-5-carboxymethylaminomethyl(34) synthesis GTPase MnmE [Rhodospirillales bacterium]